jgi:hypothetical protein
MTITISSEDPRSIKAIDIAAGARQWLKCHIRDGQKAFGVPSQCQPGRYYLVTCQSCDCTDFRRNGLSGARRGHSGEHRPCKHILAVRLYCELAKAQQARPGSRRRCHLAVVATTKR